jgi:hypothetical protein
MTLLQMQARDCSTTILKVSLVDGTTLMNLEQRAVPSLSSTISNQVVRHASGLIKPATFEVIAEVEMVLYD